MRSSLTFVTPRVISSLKLNGHGPDPSQAIVIGPELLLLRSRLGAYQELRQKNVNHVKSVERTGPLRNEQGGDRTGESLLNVATKWIRVVGYRVCRIHPSHV